MSLDLSTYPDCCMAFGLYELTTARLIKQLLSPGSHFVDAGANIGYFTLIAAQRVGPTGRVDAFEPQPDNRKRLLEHLQANRLTDHVTVHALALSDRFGVARIHSYRDDPSFNHGCASMFASASEGSASVSTVKTDRLDKVLEATSPALIKIDVEGAEPAVIEGAASLLTGTRPAAIIGEYNPRQAKVAAVSADLWVRRAVEIQPAYQVYVIGSKLRPIDVDQITGADLGEVNLLLQCPSARSDPH